LEGIAKRHMDADGELSKEQAIAKALEENPDLYDRYMSEGV
ncbi:unnamed protein product, partial [marine sediment metagenome]